MSSGPRTGGAPAEVKIKATSSYDIGTIDRRLAALSKMEKTEETEREVDFLLELRARQ